MARILVADDEDVLRMLIVDTLEDDGHEIEEAEDGTEALEKIESQFYDVVILDYMMPGLTGMEVLKSLSDSVKENSKIVMLTAKAQDQDRQEALDAGASYFVAKPFSPSELSMLVGDIV
ncbi:response regulator [Paenalkalicoccus suaedae]|uniref:Response regulator n=1 Tax=Paenalkalicoccus suaedae TaxID=2592382 RepID=A0A859FIJ7_9BACI|nr:response regulator [Paenalkalicoccus suaedae]QKS72899.1 response regulator [Paenalkalicoccus suaedae]